MLSSFWLISIASIVCSDPQPNSLTIINRYELAFTTFVNETHATAEVDSEIFDNVTDDQIIIIRLRYPGSPDFDPDSYTGYNQPDQFILKNKTSTSEKLTQSTIESNSSPLVFVFAIIMALTFFGLVVVALLYVRSERRRKIEAIERQVASENGKDRGVRGSRGSSEVEMDENGESIQSDSKFGSTTILVTVKGQSRQPERENFIESVQAPPELPLAFFSGINTQQSAFSEKPSLSDSEHLRLDSQSTSSANALLSAPAENVGSYPWPTQASEAQDAQEEGGKKKKKKKKKKNAEDVMPSLEGESIQLDVMGILETTPPEPQPTIPEEQPPEFMEYPQEDMGLPQDEEGDKKKKKKKKKKKQSAQDEFADF